MDESDNLRPVTLVTGYQFMRDAERQLGGRGLYKRARDADAIPAGLAHAVRSGEQESICDKTMRKIEGSWPPGMGSLCPECREKTGI